MVPPSLPQGHGGQNVTAHMTVMSVDTTERITPDFIGIGAPRCGTRWLAQCMEEHPQIALPETEVYYFTRRRVVYPFWYRGYEWYENELRQGVTEQTKVLGEVTPVYLFDEDTPSLIHHEAPNAKLICCVRDQSRRAESWYRLFLRFNPTLTTENYPIVKFLTYQNDVYGREGFYLEHLQRYFTLFPAEQILILTFDELESDPLSYVRRVFEFLGVDSSFVPPSVKQRINRLAPEVRMKSAENTELDLGTKPLVARADSQEAVDALRMPAELRQQMHRLYSEHNLMLGELLGRDLSHWNTEQARP